MKFAALFVAGLAGADAFAPANHGRTARTSPLFDMPAPEATSIVKDAGDMTSSSPEAAPPSTFGTRTSSSS